jgi:hypothetical protein
VLGIKSPNSDTVPDDVNVVLHIPRKMPGPPWEVEDPAIRLDPGSELGADSETHPQPVFQLVSRLATPSK